MRQQYILYDARTHEALATGFWDRTRIRQANWWMTNRGEPYIWLLAHSIAQLYNLN